MDILLIMLLILINGLFAMSELALAASRKSRLTTMAEAGDRGAKAALALLDHPNHFLSTIQVGITSIGVLNGIVGEAAFSVALGQHLQVWGWSEQVAALTATALVVTLITFLTIIFGELVPKRIGQMYPEAVARWVSRPMQWTALVARPFVLLLSATTQGALRLFGLPNQVARSMTAEEIRASLEEGVDAGVIEQHEHQMVQNVFRLDDRPLTSLMVPRSDIVWLDASLTLQQSIEQVVQADERNAHSWYPVCRGSLDDVVGLISVSRLLELSQPSSFDPQRTLADMETDVQAAMFVPETLSGMELLEQFKQRSGRIVFVVDEYGVLQGLITPVDLLEAITGELQPLAQMDAWATEREDGSWLLDGMMPVDELRSRLDIKCLPAEDKGRYNTLAGMLLSVAGHLPKTGERIASSGWWFEVVDLDGWRIDKVIASRQE
jgi:putative hemolysin